MGNQIIVWRGTHNLETQINLRYYVHIHHITAGAVAGGGSRQIENHQHAYMVKKW